MADEDRISIDDAIRTAVALHQQGHLEDAEIMYSKILNVVPDHPDALHYLGLMHHQLGSSDKGIDLIRKATVIASENPAPFLNLGNIYRQLGRVDDAETAYKKVLELAPDDADALCNLGSLYRNQKKIEEAKSLLERVIEIDPSHAEGLHQLGYLARQEGDLQASITLHQRAVEIYQRRGSGGSAAIKLATVLRQAGRPKEAGRVLRELLVTEPNNVLGQHMLAAISGEDVPVKADERYVKELFNSFAGSFDEVLDNLHYRAPKVIGQMLEREFDVPDQSLDVLDAGCGTGLSGVVVKPYARTLTGVDLSPGMIARAKGRKIYDQLVEGEIAEFLAQRSQAYDIIVSADVLIYFGDLAEVFRHVCGALRPGGIFCLTLEKTDTSLDNKGYVLEVHGRYSHQRHYVLDLLSKNGMHSIQVDDVVLRLESGQPVSGMVVLARAAQNDS